MKRSVPNSRPAAAGSDHQPLGIDRHPELLKDYFGNYTTLVYLAQTEDSSLRGQAEAAATAAPRKAASSTCARS